MAEVFTHMRIVNKLMAVGYSSICIVATIRSKTLNHFIAFGIQLLSEKQAWLFISGSNICTAEDFGLFRAVSLADLFAYFVVYMWNAFRL